jgi:hypothetical protein
MNQHLARLVLRTCLLVNLVGGLVLGSLSAVLGERFLPHELAEWNATHAGHVMFGSPAAEWAFQGILLVAYVFGVVGIFRNRKWGAWVYLVCLAIPTLFTLTDLTVDAAWVAFGSQWMNILSGLILGIAFFSSALEVDEAP